MFEGVIQTFQEKLKGHSRLIALFVIGLLIVSLVRNIRKTLEAQERIQREEEQVGKLQEENEELKSQLEELTSDKFIEKQLREQLGLAREGEVIIVLPDEEILRKLSPSFEEEKEVLPEPNWKKWINLFQ